MSEALSSIGSAGSWDCSETCTGLARTGARQARARTCGYMKAQTLTRHSARILTLKRAKLDILTKAMKYYFKLLDCYQVTQLLGG